VSTHTFKSPLVWSNTESTVDVCWDLPELVDAVDDVVMLAVQNDHEW